MSTREVLKRLQQMEHRSPARSFLEHLTPEERADLPRQRQAIALRRLRELGITDLERGELMWETPAAAAPQEATTDASSDDTPPPPPRPQAPPDAPGATRSAARPSTPPPAPTTRTTQPAAAPGRYGAVGGTRRPFDVGIDIRREIK
jgi:hypothetical protein